MDAARHFGQRPQLRRTTRASPFFDRCIRGDAPLFYIQAETARPVLDLILPVTGTDQGPILRVVQSRLTAGLLDSRSVRRYGRRVETVTGMYGRDADFPRGRRCGDGLIAEQRC